MRSRCRAKSWPGGRVELRHEQFVWLWRNQCLRNFRKSLISLSSRLFAQQIVSIFARAFLRLLFSPRCDFAVISAQQDFRNFPAAEFRRACVLWPLQQTFAKTVVVGGLFVAENTGDESDNRINEDDSCDR